MAAKRFDKCTKARVYDNGKMVETVMVDVSIKETLEGIWKKWPEAAVVLLRTTEDYGICLVAPAKGLADAQKVALKADVADHFAWLASRSDGAENFKPAEIDTVVVAMPNGALAIWPGKDPRGDATGIPAEIDRWGARAKYTKPAGSKASTDGIADFKKLLEKYGGIPYTVNGQ